MNVKDMNVGTRLALGYAVVLALLCVIIGSALYGMAAMREKTRIITDINNAQIEQAGKLATSVANRMIIVRNLALLTDQQAMAREMQNMQAEADRYASAYQRMQPLFNLPETKPEERAAFLRLKEMEDKTLPVLDKAARLGLANQDDETTRVLLDEVRPVQAEWMGAIDALIALENRLNQQSDDEAQSTYASARNLCIVLGAAAIVAGVLAALLVTRTLLGQLGGEPAYAKQVAERIAAGDLEHEVMVRAGDTGSMMLAMKTMRDSLAGIVGQVRSGTDAIASASAQVAAGSLNLSARTEEQAGSLEETASSMEELTGTVKQNADNARQAGAMASTASNVARRGGVAIREVVGTMTAISNSAAQIRDIIGVIDGIAFQTNILALNAAVEAARAGEQGRGFAVVATEVRNLAQRSAAAAREIKALIEVSTANVDEGARRVAAAGATMTEIVDSVQRVSDVMAEITAATHEQTAGIEQINQAVVQMDQVTQQNAALVEESAAAAEAMQSQAQQLARAVSVFRTARAVVAAETRPSWPAPQAQAPAPLARAARPMAPAGGDWESF